jgi:peptidyl-prolyl cis-trans isomerase D
MFNLVTKHQRVAQIILALIMVPFAFFGVDFYFHRAGGSDVVATVGSDKVSQAEFDEALRDQQARMRQQLGTSYDPAMFDNPQVRYALVQQLVNQRLLDQPARAEHFRVSEQQLRDFIAGLAPFQEDGKFSYDRYQQVLQSQSMSPAMFEQRVRSDLTVAPLTDAVAAASIAPKSEVQRFIGLAGQKREVAVASIDPDAFLKDVHVDDAQAKAYYDQNRAAFNTPEEAKFEYVLLNADALAAQVKVDPDDVRRAYESSIKQYSTPEERQAAHILVAVKPDAPQAEKDAAKKKAEALLAQAKAHPDKFAELAKSSSQDPGSAPQGGDLGSFTRGSMVKPFEDAVFGAKVGDIIGPVQTDFGYHVIKVTGITPSRVRPLDEVKASIEADLRRTKAQAKFATAADQFQNLVYENADSLAPVAKALDLQVQTSPLVTRAQAQAIAKGNQKFVDALFSPDSVQTKRNTEAMEVTPGTLMAGRIIEHKASVPRPFEQVKDEIKLQLARKQASELAQKAGQEKLARLRAGKADKDTGVSFAKPQAVTRNEVGPAMPPDGLKAVFQLDPGKLPAYAGAPNEKGGFSIYRVTKVIDPPPADAATLTSAGQRVSEEIGRQLLDAYVTALKAGTEVKINEANLEKK